MANRFQYSGRVRRGVTFAWASVLALNAFEYLLAWARCFYVLVSSPLSLPPIPSLAAPSDILSTLLTAHLGLAFALAASTALAYLAPRIDLGAREVTMSCALGTRRVPYGALRGLISVELSQGRFVVWVDSRKGLPWQNLIASLLFGRWQRSGFLLTSDLAGFDDVLATIVAALKSKYGEEDWKAHLREEKPTALLAMLAEPVSQLRRSASQEKDGPGRREAAGQMLSASVSLGLPLLVAGIIHLQVPWGAAPVLIFGLLEWPLASFYLSGIPVAYRMEVHFDRALALYPLTQLPRWFFAAALALVVISGLPSLFLFLAAFPAIAVGGYLVFRLTDDWFEVRFPDGLLSPVVTVVWQFVLYLLLALVLPR